MASFWSRDEEFNYPDYLLGTFQQMQKNKFLALSLSECVLSGLHLNCSQQEGGVLFSPLPAAPGARTYLWSGRTLCSRCGGGCGVSCFLPSRPAPTLRTVTEVPCIPFVGHVIESEVHAIMDSWGIVLSQCLE